MEGTDSTPVPGWELSKENVLPVKKGRSAKQLGEIFGRPVGKSSWEEEEQVFETQLKNTSDPKEKLDLYGKYIKWTRDTFPSTTEKSMKLLERCTFELQEFEEIKNDPKYVMQWIEYADMVRTPGEVFTFMSTNKIGERVALFWVAWAYVAEKALNYKLTDQIFQKGTRRNAEPKDLLSQRYKQFMRRMARQYLNNSSEEGSASTQYTESADRNAAVDNAITQRAMEAIRAQASVSAPTAASVVPTGPGERRALGQLAGSSNTQPAPAPNNNSSSAVTSRSSTAGSRVSSRGAERPRVGNAGFEIFSDTPVVGSNAPVSRSVLAPHLYEAENDSAAATSTATATASTAPVPTWKQLGSEAARRKENDGPVTKWTDGPLFPTTTTTSATTAHSTSIPIYVDEEFQVDSTSSSTANTHNVHVVPENVLSVRRQLDDVDIIAKNPLLRHTGAAASTPLTKETPAVSARVKSSSDSAKLSAPEKVEELPVFTSAPHPAVPKSSARGLSINTAASGTGSGASSTKSAGGLPFAIFSDTPTSTAHTTVSPVKRGRSGSGATLQAAAFTVYESPTHSGSAKVSNTSGAVGSSKNTTSSTGGVSTGMGFVIYSDEPVAVVKKTVNNTRSASNKVTATAKTSTTSGMGFAIYSDEPITATNTNTTIITTSSTVPVKSAGFTILSDDNNANTTNTATSTGASSTTITSSAVNSNTNGTKKGLGFAIFSDEPAVNTNNATNNATSSTVVATAASTSGAISSAKGPSFDIFVDNSQPTTNTTITQPTTTVPAPSTTSSALEEEAELQLLLDSLTAADGEDGTIHTRLARRDIDLMFCSPTIHRHPTSSNTTAKTTTKASTVFNTVTKPAHSGNMNSSVIFDENAAFSLRAPPRTPHPSADEEVDQFDNDYPESSHYPTINSNITTGRGRSVPKSSSTDSTGSDNGGGTGSGGVYPVMQEARHRPFGVHLDTFEAVKDLSAIKSSHECSMFGMMETPGHTNTLGFGAGARHQQGGRASYSMGGLMDFDISHSRESIGSVHAPHTTSAHPSGREGCSAEGASQGGLGLGFSIFQDTPCKDSSERGGEGSGAGLKRKGLSESAAPKPYTGV